MNYIFAPHLDDEIIGCYSIIDTIDKIIYWSKDYREEYIKHFPKLLQDKYVHYSNFDYSIIKPEDTIYLPSRFDFHPLHHQVRKIGEAMECKKMYYSIEMNVPWLEEEKRPESKLELLKIMYPKESLFITNEKYWLFKSIKEYDYDNQSKTYIYFKFQKEGYHAFPEAKTNPKYNTNDEYDVSFLSERHFHYFHFKVWIEVKHNNRDIEFIQERRWVENQYKNGALELNNKSCEMIAEDLLNILKKKYPTNSIKIDVSEDDINGAYLEYLF